MNTAEVLALTPESLASKQYAILQKHLVDRLKEVARLVGEKKWMQVESLLFFSPAGDGMGCDNSCISFLDSGAGEDISDVIRRLQELDKIIRGSKR
jgi:replication-associated recombination protein RarA